MRITVDIDADVLQTVKDLAAKRKVTLAAIISDLVRRGLQSPRTRAVKIRNGVPVLPRRPRGARRPTMESVNRLRDDASRDTGVGVAPP